MLLLDKYRGRGVLAIDYLDKVVYNVDYRNV